MHLYVNCMSGPQIRKHLGLLFQSFLSAILENGCHGHQNTNLVVVLWSKLSDSADSQRCSVPLSRSSAVVCSSHCRTLRWCLAELFPFLTFRQAACDFCFKVTDNWRASVHRIKRAFRELVQNCCTTSHLMTSL